ncbi:MAG: hypothetical protein AAB354_17440 [candidate division KSB1 bacterium]
MLTKRTLNAPDWLEEKDFLSLLLSHAATKHEYFDSRNRVFTTKHGCDYEVFKARVEGTQTESFGDWDDLIAWEAFHTASQEWKARYKELQACLAS